MNKINRTTLIVASLVVVLFGVFIWAFISFLSKPDKPSADSKIPVISLNIPSSSLELAQSDKTLEVSLKSTHTEKIARVEYSLDGAVVARSIEPPFQVTINLGKLEPGYHTLQATARDTAKNTVKSKVFAFKIQEDDSVVPSDEESEAIVESSSDKFFKKPASKKKTTTGSTQSGDSGQTSEDEDDDDGDVLGDYIRTAGGWWASLPQGMQVCSNGGWNGGPAAAPDGAITVPAGDNEGFAFHQDNKTFWFAPGEHTLGTGQFSKISPGNGSTYIGAPGAILDGKNNNLYAFGESADNVRIAYLEIRNFGRGNDNNNEGVINHDSGANWMMEYLYAHHNDGAAVFVGSGNTVRYSCLKDNGQYGFSMYKDPLPDDSPIKNITLTNNEISGNNQDDWEEQIDGCGCTGGGKFWDVLGATVTNNYVHDNLSTGLWADTNDIDFLFDSNWIEHNEGEGIWYEISYNATISRNVMKRNAWTNGVNNLGSPGPAIYLSESGGDSRLPSAISGSTDLRINNNLLEDNFSGVSIYENANRFCNSNGNTSKTYCTPFITPQNIPEPYDYDYLEPINSTHPCYTNISSEPYKTDCRWHSKNVQVFDNEFRFTAANVPCAGSYCGAHALFVTGSDNLPWMPYTVTGLQNDVMFNNNNKFFNNKYFGNWKFAKGWGETVGWNVWRTAPYNQDVGSTLDGDSVLVVENVLNPDTATFEGSIGQWQDWYSTTPTQSTDQAHTGTNSMKVLLTGSGGWAVQLSNYPGFTIGPGAKRASFWARQGSGSIANVSLHVKWYNGAQQLVQTDTVPLTLNGSWQQATADLTAPADVATVHLDFMSGSGSTGDSIYIDDVIVGDRP